MLCSATEKLVIYDTLPREGQLHRDDLVAGASFR